MNEVEVCLSKSLSRNVKKPTAANFNFSKFANTEKLLDAIQQNIVIVDQHNKSMLWSSSAFRSLFPLTESAASLDDLTLVFDGLSGCFDKILGNESKNPVFDKTFLVCYKSEQYFSVSITLLENQYLVLCFNGIDENVRLMQRHLEDREKLLFTSRAISVSEMATIMSHELNQPIGTISNLLRGISLRLKKGEYASAEITAALDSAINQSLFAAKIINRVREFTHSFRPKHIELDFSLLTEDCIAMLDWEIQRDGIAVIRSTQTKDKLMVLGDDVMLRQVLINLLRNAFDAMRMVAFGEKKIEVILRTNKELVEVSISDNGCGFTSEAENNLFVPFVSTKPSGMGIGLNICRSFIELHQGKLWMTNNKKSGCTFHIGLPKLAKEIVKT